MMGRTFLAAFLVGAIRVWVVVFDGEIDSVHGNPGRACARRNWLQSIVMGPVRPVEMHVLDQLPPDGATVWNCKGVPPDSGPARTPEQKRDYERKSAP